MRRSARVGMVLLFGLAVATPNPLEAQSEECGIPAHHRLCQKCQVNGPWLLQANAGLTAGGTDVIDFCKPGCTDYGVQQDGPCQVDPGDVNAGSAAIRLQSLAMERPILAANCTGGLSPFVPAKITETAAWSPAESLQIHRQITSTFGN